MGSATVKIFTCDKCGVEKRGDPWHHRQCNELVFSQNYSEGPGPSGKFHDLCHECNRRIGEILDIVKKELGQ